MGKNHVYFYRSGDEYIMELFCDSNVEMQEKPIVFKEDNLFELGKIFEDITGKKIFTLCDKIGEPLDNVPDGTPLEKELLENKKIYVDYIKQMEELDFIKELFAVSDYKKNLGITEKFHNKIQWKKITPNFEKELIYDYQSLYYFD